MIVVAVSLQQSDGVIWWHMKEIVRTVLPLLTWHFQQVFDSVLSADEWHGWALALVPPPDNVVNTIVSEWAEYDSSALLSSSARRRFRKWAQRRIRRSLRNDPLVLPTREYFRRRWATIEAKGYKFDASRLVKWRDVEDEVNDFWLRLFHGEEPPEELRAVIRSHPDALNLLWELAIYGRTEQKLRVRRNSALYSITGIDPDRLENAKAEDAGAIFSHLFDRLGLEDNPPDRTTIMKLVWWLMKHLLPHESEPQKDPSLLEKTDASGVIYRGVTTGWDEETGEVQAIDVVDPSIMQTDFLALDGDEAIYAYFAQKGINYDDLAPKDWAEIFERRDLYRMGYEFSSKKGVGMASFYGEAAELKEQRWSRLMRRIKKLQRMAEEPMQ